MSAMPMPTNMQSRITSIRSDLALGTVKAQELREALGDLSSSTEHDSEEGTGCDI